MAARQSYEQPLARICLAGLLSWLIPGAGHIFIGQRTRGLILLVTIAVTFWVGIGIGGVYDTVYPQKRFPWFMAQICTGGHGLLAYAWGESLRPPPPLRGTPIPFRNPSFTSVDAAVVYTGIAGLLNLLVILDAIGRADRPREQESERRRRASGVAATAREETVA